MTDEDECVIIPLKVLTYAEVGQFVIYSCQVLGKSPGFARREARRLDDALAENAPGAAEVWASLKKVLDGLFNFDGISAPPTVH